MGVPITTRLTPSPLSGCETSLQPDTSRQGTLTSDQSSMSVPTICEATPNVTSSQAQWRYEIKYGPEGEANYAWVYDADGGMVCTAKTYHAKAIVDRMNVLSQLTASPDREKAGEPCRDWKTIEEQIATSQGNDLLALLRGYLEINLEPGNDLARLYISRISAILSTIAPDEAAIRAAHIDVLHGLESKISDALNWNGPDKTQGEHMFHMLSVIENSSDMPVDKIARWTGFIQGVLAARGLLDVDEERNRTRPIFAAAIRSQEAGR